MTEHRQFIEKPTQKPKNRNISSKAIFSDQKSVVLAGQTRVTPQDKQVPLIEPGKTNGWYTQEQTAVKLDTPFRTTCKESLRNTKR